MSSVPSENGTTSRTIHRLLEKQAGRAPGAIALAAPGRAPLTYGRLADQTANVVKTLNALGVTRNDRVALVLPNGPEMAAAFLAVAAGATCAPLNPGYRASEFEFYLNDLKAKVLIVQAGVDSPAISVAEALGVSVIRLLPALEAEAGIFHLQGASPGSASANFAQPDDIALVLHTSGTTSRPKIVPLTQANLCTSAGNIKSTLRLQEGDRCLNVMPLFHIHGLMGALLSSMTAGASVVCTPGFYAPQFFDWVDAFRPTWYSAVPTMHQAILARAAANQEVIGRSPLRLIRSSSSALPPQVMAELETAFGAPVIESYGMTEASHQMASNPLPPLPRKPGSVGKAAGPEVAIMDQAGSLLPRGQTGEVVIRGASVTPGYENNSKANEGAFTNGWFRTGDQGYLDADDYLFLTGRIKELINRGGEKISPREVDEVLLDHPAVAQAVAFAVPDTRLGEEVAAAVVLRPDASVTEKALQRFAADRLADFKVPRRVLVVKEIPKGPTGKLQRIGLAEKLGLTELNLEPAERESEFVSPRTATEETLAKIWVRLLKVERVGVRDDFFRCGGDSVLATGLFAEIHKAFGKNLPMATLLEGTTVEFLAGVIDGHCSSWPALVPLQPRGSATPLFCVHGVGGNVVPYKDLARRLAPDQPLYGLQNPITDGVAEQFPNLEAMAVRYLEEVRAVQPHGPYLLGGYSLGGAVAFEMAQQLHAQGQETALVVILDDMVPSLLGRRMAWWNPAFMFAFLKNAPRWVREELFAPGSHGLLSQVRSKAAALRRRIGNALSGQGSRRSYLENVFNLASLPEGFRRVMEANHALRIAYNPQPYSGRVALFRARTRPLLAPRAHDLGWSELAGGGLDIAVVPGNHDTMLREPHVQVLADRLKACLRKAQTSGVVGQNRNRGLGSRAAKAPALT
jgi:acyl-CoA synthetase (AMP-forming)/AMP-acid ligase II/thioesterase domain-containing protein